MPDRSRRQRAKATREPGGIGLDRLADLVDAADDGRHRTDRPGAPTAEEARQAHARLLEALEVVPEGLVLLNAEGRCVFFNRHFLEIYDIAPDTIAVGVKFFDAVRAGLERGLYLDAIGREEEWLAERAEQIGKDRSSTEQHLSGDRWVRIEERRTADGGSIGIRIDITDLKRREKALEKLAYFDPLTGLANRALFQRELDNVLARCGKSGSRAALLLLDLDHFKEVNDSLGHEAGDELLVRVSQLIAKVLDENHFFCRLGGDEFAVIMPGDPSKSAVMRLAAKIVVAASGTVVLERGEVGVGTSIGIALVPEDSHGAVDLQRKADLALYRAKANGRGRFAFFEHEMSTVLQYKTALARELRRAVTENIGLEVHYQPQVTLASGRVTGYEALMRWRHPALGMVPPSEFIPVAESSHLICDLGLYVLRQAVGQARAWLDAGETGREISVNVSAAQIWQTDFINDVARVLAETGLPPNLLCVELTESLLADHSAGRVRGVLTSLKRLGVSLALDDFGTDYSSLGYLTQLPFDKIKIDRIFVAEVETSERARRLLEGVIALGRGLGMTIVAEGAETAEQLAILDDFRCDIVQGFVFARPGPADDALAVARALEGHWSAEGVQPPPGALRQAVGAA